MVAVVTKVQALFWLVNAKSKNWLKYRHSIKAYDVIGQLPVAWYSLMIF